MENERKKMRFEVLLERYFTNFHRILLTNLLFLIPSAVVFTAVYFLNIALFGGIVTPVAMLAIVPLFPFLSGVVMVCRNLARGESNVRVCKTYFTAIKENFLSFLLHGVLIYIASVLSFLSISLYVSMLQAGWFFYVFLFFCIVISLFLLYTAFYVPLMSITYDLPLRYVYKNSFLMSFGEFKNNLFATIALAVVFGICFTATAFLGSVTALVIVAVALWALFLPATCVYMIVFFIDDGMTAIMRSKDDRSRELSDAIQKSIDQQKNGQAQQPAADDFSDIDISALKDTDEYIFHNGRMVKQSTLLRMVRERQQQEETSDE